MPGKNVALMRDMTDTMYNPERPPGVSHFAGTDLVVRPIMREGATPEQVAAMTLGDAPVSADLDRLRRRRVELGIPSGDGDPLVVDPSGRTVGVEALPLHLRKARSYQVGVDANTSICRGQLAARYGV